MKLYDFGILAIIVTIVIAGTAGAVIENEKDLVPNKEEAGE